MSIINTEEDTIGPPRLSERVRSFSKKLLSNRNAKIGIGLLVPITTVVILAPIIATQDPTTTNYGQTYASPALSHLFGTDQFGRDLFSRTIYGGRASLLIGLSSVALASVIGIPVGIASGYYSGKTDEILMRGMDLLMTFPPIILALLLLIILAPSMSSAVIAIGIVFAPRIARVARSSTLAVRDSEYIQACEQRDESSLYIMFYEILPNIKGPIIIEATIRIGFAIMIGAALSFLGLGVQPPTPDWGNMISEARNEIQNSIWMLVWPSLSLSATILGFNLLGDGLGDVLNDELSEED